jgi:hypothetical protein
MSAGPKVAAGADWLSANMGLKNWSKSLRNPVKVFKFTRDKFAAGVKTGMLSKGFLGRMAASGTGSTLLGAGATVAAPFNVAWIGDMFGVNDKFQQGSKPDLAAEGVLFGASMGAFGGGPGAAIGAAVGGTLNVLTNGALVESAQQIPWLGGFFGANKGEIDMREIALNMYTAAAEAQGDPELAELAASILEPYLKMIEAEKLPAGSEMEYILMAARQAGFTGFPWAPEEILPAYSADDLAQITGAVSEELQPMFDLANGLVKQDFAHIQDDEMRSKLIESAQDSAANLMESVGVAMMGPASAGILTEAQRRQSSTDLSSQLAADDEFAMMFANAAGM